MDEKRSENGGDDQIASYPDLYSPKEDVHRIYELSKTKHGFAQEMKK